MPGKTKIPRYLPTGLNISGNNHKGLILCTIVATGIASVVSQLLFIRELLSQFAGNEFLISLIIFIWLICGGTGTLLSQISRRYLQSTQKRLSLFSLGLVGLAPLQVLAIRFLRDIVFTPGSAVGFYSSLGFVAATIAPYALLIGFVLPYSLFVLRNSDPETSGTLVFITDNIGDVLGGALFSFVLVFFFEPLTGIFLAHLPLLILCILLIPRNLRLHPFYLLVFAFFLAVLCSGIFLRGGSLNFARENTVFFQESKYGRIQVLKDKEQYTLYNQGEPLYSTQNLYAAEETVHYPLSQLQDPEDILLISARSNTLREIDKYAPGQVDYVEIDPVLTHVQFKYGFLERIPALRIINQDARAYLSSTNNKYDVIISSLHEPQTFQTNRFYTREFFQLVKKHLSSRGVWSFSVQGFANYLSQPARKKISSLYASAKEHFEHVQLLPGKQTFFLCSDSSINTNIPELLRKKGIDTQFVQFYYSGNVTPQRIQGLQERIQPGAMQNTDLKPRLMQIMFAQWFSKHGTSPVVLYWVLGILGSVYMIWISREEFVLFSTGFMNMGSEILLIFAFQIFYGYIYYLIGLMVTVFLAGLLPGAIWGQSIREQGRKLFVYTDIALVLLMLFFLLSINYIGAALPVSFFLGTGFLISLFCGLQFPVALQIRQEQVSAITRFFSADIIGAAAGALVISVIIIPLLGVVWAIWALVGIKTASLILNGVEK